MSNQVTPEAAVEAAMIALDEAGYGTRSQDELRTALEAAAPHMHRASWIEGYDSAKRYHAGGEE